MKKHLIAAAVAAAVAAPAMAQNVTIAGTLDATAYQVIKQSAGNPTAAEAKLKATSNNSMWATSVLNFTGSEDLGGGLKATFFFNTALADAAANVASRDRWLELEGGFGSLRFGRYEATTTALGGYVSPSGSTNAGGTFESTAGDLQDGTLGLGNAVTLGRNSNLARWVSPAFAGGFRATAEYRLNSTDNAEITAGSTVNNGKAETQSQGVRLDYSAGPLSIAASYTKADIDRETTAAPLGSRSDEVTMSWLGVIYNFGPLTVNFAHAQRKDENGAIAASANPVVAAAAAVTTSDIKVSTIGVAVPVGALTLSASIYQGADDGTVGANDDLDLKGYQLAARYALSKRTAFYGVISQQKEENESPNGNALYFKDSRYGARLRSIRTGDRKCRAR